MSTALGASADEFRQLMSAFPTGVSVVTATDRSGLPRGMTCSSLTSVTVRPPTILVCLRLGSPTLSAVQERQRFAVNLLHDRGQRAAEVFARVPVPERFSRVAWRWLPSGLPWLSADALAVADCVVAHDFEVGDHAVVLGEVREITMADPAEMPLLYGRRQFASWDASRRAALRLSR